MVIVMRRVRKNVSLIVDLKDEVVKVFVDEVEVSKAEFKFDNTQIMVTDVSTEEKYQKCGYGRLLFDGLKLIAEQKKKPLILWALDTAIPFYEAIGLLHLDNPATQKRVIFGNIKKSKLSEKIDDDDFVWIPKSLKRKPIIYL
jgi:GNAT superfamily N-acetyltransferase